MGPETTMPEASDADAERRQERPRASNWLWRPWYAKLWWTCLALYWTGKLGSYWSPALDALYTTAAAGYLNVAFYPMIASMVLGVGFVRVWMDERDWEWHRPTYDQTFLKQSGGGFRDPIADPLDPRSPSHWRYLEDLD